MLVNKVRSNIKSVQMVEHQRNPMLIKMIVQKMPPYLKLAFAERWPDERKTSLFDLADWLLRKADAAGLLFTRQHAESQPKASNNRKRSERVNVHIPTASNDDSKAKTQGCKVCKEAHELHDCQKFKEMYRPDRWKVVVENKMCANCLLSHNYRHCKNAGKCTVDVNKRECKYRHLRVPGRR